MTTNSEEQEDLTIGEIFHLGIDCCIAGDLTPMSEFMQALKLEDLSVAVMLAPLSITVPVAHEVEGRMQYFDRVCGELVRRERTDILALMAGLSGRESVVRTPAVQDPATGKPLKYGEGSAE
jgi:hypothetical protein